MAPALDLVRLFAGATLLAFASYTDWQWRRAPNALWWIAALIGVILLGAEAALDPTAFTAAWGNLLFIPIFAAVIYGLWWFGLIAGGADAKALMAIGVLMPYPIRLAENIPLIDTPLPGAFSVLGNSLLLFLAIPLVMTLWNLAHFDLRVPHLFLGIKRRGSDIRQGHAWPMEILDDEGNRRTKLFGSRMDPSEIDEQFDRLHALGNERIWVTPKIPFMIPMLAGFLTTFLVGDLMFTGVQLIVDQMAGR